LAREEARPFDHYAYTSPVSGERSPLASGLEPFVVGAFQIDPEGAVTTPLDPADAAVARVRAAVDGLWSVNEKDDVARSSELKKLETLGYLSGGKDEGEDADRQAPGTTAGCAEPGGEERQEQAAPEAPAPAREREQIGAFDALQSLNRAADVRAERKQKGARV